MSLLTRQRLALLIVLVLAVGAALPALTDAAVRAAKATIGTAQLKNGAVTNAKVRPGSLRYTAFAKGQVARANLKGIAAGGVLTGTYPQPGLANGSVRAPQIATGAVGKSEIAAGAVGSEELAAGAVRAADIANGSIGASKLAPNSVGKGQIAAGGVGASELARGAVGVSELAALPGASAYRPDPYGIPAGTITEVPLTATAFNQGGVWAAGQPTRLTAPVDGVYLATAGAVFAANGTGVRALWIIPTGAAERPFCAAQEHPINQVDEPTALTCMATVRLSAGESVSLAVRQTSGGTLQLLAPGQATGLALQFLSP